MNDKELAGALLVRLVNNDMLTGVITELCSNLQRDAPKIYAYKIKYLCNLLREKARKYDRNVWVKFAAEQQEDYIYKALDGITEMLAPYVEKWRSTIEADYNAVNTPFSKTFAWMHVAVEMCKIDAELSKRTTVAPVAMRVLDTGGIRALTLQLVETMRLVPTIKARIKNCKQSVAAFNAGVEYLRQLTNIDNYNNIIK